MDKSPGEFDLPTEAEDISPLRGMLYEVHEIFEELEEVGFSERVRVQIVAHMLYDAMAYRNSGDEDSEDDDEDELNDTDGDIS